MENELQVSFTLDGVVYQGRVVDIDKETKLCKVLMVDGNIHYKELCEMELKF